MNVGEISFEGGVVYPTQRQRFGSSFSASLQTQVQARYFVYTSGQALTY